VNSSSEATDAFGHGGCSVLAMSEAAGSGVAAATLTHSQSAASRGGGVVVRAAAGILLTQTHAARLLLSSPWSWARNRPCRRRRCRCTQPPGVLCELVSATLSLSLSALFACAAAKLAVRCSLMRSARSLAALCAFAFMTFGPKSQLADGTRFLFVFLAEEVKSYETTGGCFF
jgi:hypothetical protein